MDNFSVKNGPDELEEGVTVARISRHDQRLTTVEDRSDSQADQLRTLQM